MDGDFTGNFQVMDHSVSPCALDLGAGEVYATPGLSSAMEASGGVTPCGPCDTDALFEEHLNWAAKIARSERRKLPPSFDVDDLQQEARIELWRQVQRFDASLGVPFRAFAYFAVRGAVLMSCRRKQYREATHEELKATSHHLDKRLRPDELLIAREEWRNRLGPKLYRNRRKVLAALQRIPAEAAHLVRMVYLECADVDELERRAPGSKQKLGRALQTLRRVVLAPRRVEKTRVERRIADRQA